jgi:prephenate dehydrogenase
LRDIDIVVLAVPLIDLEDAVESLPIEALRGKLVVDVCPLNSHPKSVMTRVFRNVPEVDILCTNPMFGPATLSTEGSWDGRPMVYEKVRVSNMARCDKYLNIFEEARCNLVEMPSEQHDATTANAEFVTHLVGRLLDQKLLPATPVMSKEYAALCDVADMTAADSFDLFFGMFKYNDKAKDHLASMRDGLANIERELAAREAYLAAKSEMKKTDRQRLLAETRLLIMELAKNGGLYGVLESAEAAASGEEKADSASKEAPETTK